MKFVEIAICALAAFAAPATAFAAPADDTAIKALEAKFAEAVSGGNVDAIMQAYVPDDSLFVFDLVPPRQYVGAAAYRADWSAFLKSFSGPVTFQISDLSVSTDGMLGYGHSIQHIAGKDAKGQPSDVTVRVSDVYKKIKGKWLIVMEHVSVPVDMDTGKPDLMSKP